MSNKTLHTSSVEPCWCSGPLDTLNLELNSSLGVSEGIQKGIQARVWRINQPSLVPEDTFISTERLSRVNAQYDSRILVTMTPRAHHCGVPSSYLPTPIHAPAVRGFQNLGSNFCNVNSSSLLRRSTDEPLIQSAIFLSICRRLLVTWENRVS